MIGKCQARAFVRRDENWKAVYTLCGAPTVPDRSYCSTHLREALQRVALASPVNTIRGLAVPVLEKPR